MKKGPRVLNGNNGMIQANKQEENGKKIKNDKT